ncbi:MAG: hypothetical protein ABA06_02085 [Parcubacteria bacterium C7867-001]|nr:MAG: hypothetical protein ABA06_02085 [Parcubacteria bacterium C7867-001]
MEVGTEGGGEARSAQRMVEGELKVVFSPVFLVMDIIVCVMMIAFAFMTPTKGNKILFSSIGVLFGVFAVMQMLAKFDII